MSRIADWFDRVEASLPKGYTIAQEAEIDRLRKIETAARALKFSAYPAHGSGFVLQVTDGNVNDLEAALGSHEQKAVEK